MALCLMSYRLLLCLAIDHTGARLAKYKYIYEMLLQPIVRPIWTEERQYFAFCLVSRQMIVAPVFLSRVLDLLCPLILSHESSLIFSNPHNLKIQGKKHLFLIMLSQIEKVEPDLSQLNHEINLYHNKAVQEF